MAGGDSDDEKRSGRKGSSAGRKFTQKTKEYKKLEKMFRERKIAPCDKPSDIRATDPCFAQFTTTQFRSQFNKLKGVHGTCSREGFKKSMAEKAEDMDDDDSDDSVTLPEEINGHGRHMLKELYGSDFAKAALADGTAFAIGAGNHKLLDWIPKKIVNEWENDDGIRNLTMIVALTGGAADKSSSGVECKVTADGSQFVISEQWSSMVVDIADFYKPLAAHRPKDETEDEFCRRRFAMSDQVRKMMKAGGFQKGDPMMSVYRMPLPFQVDPMSLRVQVCGAKDGSRFCHVDLTEKQKLVVQSVLMLDSGRGHNKVVPETPAKYSSINH